MAPFRPIKDLLTFGIFVIIGIIIYGNFFLDKTLERALEQTMGSITGAEVEIDGLKSYFRGPSLSFEAMRLVDPHDPWRNLIEIGRLGFHMEAAPLLWKSMMIDNLYITNIQFGIERKSPGRILQKNSDHSNWVSEAEKGLQEQVATPPFIDLFSLEMNTDSLLTYLDLKSRNYLAETESNADSIFGRWSRFTAELEKRFGDVNRETASASTARSNDTSQPQDLRKTEWDSTKKEVKEDFEKPTQALDHLNYLISQDIDGLKSQPPIIDMESLVNRLLFGKPLADGVSRVLQYIDILRKLIPGKNQALPNAKTENPRRFRGQDIVYPWTSSIPKLWIGRIKVENPPPNREQTGDLFARATIRGMRFDPQMDGQRWNFRVSANHSKTRMVDAMGVIDHSRASPLAEFMLGITGSEGLTLHLHKHQFLPEKIRVDGTLSANFEIVGNDVEAHATMAVRFEFPDTVDGNTGIAQRIRETIEAKEPFDVRAELINSSDGPRLEFFSKSSQTLAKLIQQLLSDVVKRQHGSISATLRVSMTHTKAEILALIQSRQAQVLSEIARIERRSDGQDSPHQ